MTSDRLPARRGPWEAVGPWRGWETLGTCPARPRWCSSCPREAPCWSAQCRGARLRAAGPQNRPPAVPPVSRWPTAAVRWEGGMRAAAGPGRAGPCPSPFSPSRADPSGCFTPLSPSVSQRQAWVPFYFRDGGGRTGRKRAALGEALRLRPAFTCSSGST